MAVLGLLVVPWLLNEVASHVTKDRLWGSCASVFAQLELSHL